MIIEDFEQYSDEWWDARVGIPTASMFGKIITSTGKEASSWKSEAFRFAAEREMGKCVDTYQNDAMRRGTELEPEAREAYRFQTDNDVREVGLVYQDEKKMWSCSPDGLVDPDGGLEIKCPGAPVHMQYRYEKVLPLKYRPQIWGSLWITGLEWWDFFSYHPDLKPFLIRASVKDEGYKKYAKALEKYLPEFVEFVEKIK